MKTQELTAALRVFAGEGAQTNYARVVQRKAADAIESLQSQLDDYTVMMTAERDALQARINELEQSEPVAYSVGNSLRWHDGKGMTNAQLYARPAKTQPLEWEQVRKLILETNKQAWAKHGRMAKDEEIARATEAAPPASAQAGYTFSEADMQKHLNAKGIKGVKAAHLAIKFGKSRETPEATK